MSYFRIILCMYYLIKRWTGFCSFNYEKVWIVKLGKIKKLFLQNAVDTFVAQSCNYHILPSHYPHRCAKICKGGATSDLEIFLYHSSCPNRTVVECDKSYQNNLSHCKNISWFSMFLFHEFLMVLCSFWVKLL